MDERFTVRNLKAGELTDMYLTFLDAFSDYPVSFQLSKEHFVRKFVQKLNIDFPLSSGVYDYSGALEAFIFTSVNFYQGKRTAYNGGTGVRPRKRGNRLTQAMYEFLIPKFKREGIYQCVLEVLTQNSTAIKAYEGIGFERTQVFKCFTLRSEHLNSGNYPKVALELFNVNQPDFNTYEKFSDYSPSFLDSSNLLRHNLANEIVVEARHDGTCVGYAVFQPSIGRISQSHLVLIQLIFKTHFLKEIQGFNCICTNVQNGQGFLGAGIKNIVNKAGTNSI
ncbi:MAG: GNAT family N-acetyltransferase, partial [Bacteroidota bacterium]